VKVTERGTLSGQQNNVRASVWKALLGPLGRIVLAAVLVVAAVAAAQVVVKLLKDVLSLGGAAPAVYYLVYLVASVLVAYFVYRAYVRLVEKRPVTELSGARAPRELGIGAAIGLSLVAVVVGTLWVLGYYRIAGTNALGVLFVSLANDGAGAFVEEVVLRGIVFRITEEKLGTWVALAISVVLFALLHLASPNATLTSTVVVGVEGGVLLSAAYVLTRRLWLAIGVHFGWDFSQDAIFGVGKGAKGLLSGDLSGPVWLSGGSAGIEGSVVALLLCVVVGAYLLVRAGRRGNLLASSWKRDRQSRAVR
jgi:membrane protease YdiL (CAAX protease family)